MSTDDLDARVRAAMTAEATAVQTDRSFADRVIAANPRLSLLPPERRWPRMLALSAAAAVVLLAVSVAALVVHNSRGSQASAPLPTSAPTTLSAPTQPVLPAGFTVSDLTWISTDEGFALGTGGQCRVPAGISCFLVAHTTDGGSTWTQVTPGSQATAAGAIGHIRFADPSVGYVWGDHLWLTRDGGKSWQQQADRTVGNDNGAPRLLEVGNGWAIRVRFGAGDFVVERARVGTNDWTTLDMPATPEPGRLAGEGTSFESELVRSGDRAAILQKGHTAGGAGRAYSTLYVSSDNGGSWRNLGEPCPQTGGREVDSSSVSLAEDGSISVLCSPRAGASEAFMAISWDRKLTFTEGAPVPAGTRAVVSSSKHSWVAYADAIWVLDTATANQSWARVLQDLSIPTSGELPQPRFLAFESASVGRYVQQNGRAVWTTHDGGASWTVYTFG